MKFLTQILFAIVLCFCCSSSLFGQTQDDNIRLAAQILQDTQEKMKDSDFHFKIEHAMYEDQQFDKVVSSSSSEYIKSGSSLCLKKENTRILVNNGLCATVNLKDSTIILTDGSSIEINPPGLENISLMLQQANKVTVDRNNNRVSIHMDLPESLGASSMNIIVNDGWVSEISILSSVSAHQSSKPVKAIKLKFTKMPNGEISQELFKQKNYFRKQEDRYVGGEYYKNFTVLKRYL